MSNPALVRDREPLLDRRSQAGKRPIITDTSRASPGALSMSIDNARWKTPSGLPQLQLVAACRAFRQCHRLVSQFVVRYDPTDNTKCESALGGM